MTLNELATGQSAIVTAISGDGPLVQRLMALGLIEGSTVAVIRKAIGGDPIELTVMGYALSLRLEEARLVQVEVTSAP